VPTFCRHNRFIESCPICSRAQLVRPGTVSGREEAARRDRPARPDRPARSTRTRTPKPSDMVVRRVARAADDGYENDLVPGLRSSEDARRLAEEIALSVARLAAIPPAAGDVEDELRATFIATAEPTEQTFDAYAARSEKAGGQHALLSGERSLTPERRFERAFERLSLPKLSRAARYEFLLVAGARGLLDVRPSTLLLGVEPTDPTTMAAKRVFGIGDAINLQRRAAELAAACQVPIGALDLALRNWAAADDARVTPGAAADPGALDHAQAALRVRADPG
jgi:hypothetical protein